MILPKSDLSITVTIITVEQICKIEVVAKLHKLAAPGFLNSDIQVPVPTDRETMRGATSVSAWH